MPGTEEGRSGKQGIGQSFKGVYQSLVVQRDKSAGGFITVGMS